MLRKTVADASSGDWKCSVAVCWVEYREKLLVTNYCYLVNVAKLMNVDKARLMS